MLNVHTRDGQTLKFDLENKEQAKRWLILLRDPSFQSNITGMTVVHNGIQYSVPRPKGFFHLNYFAEYVQPDLSRGLKGGERIRCFADSVSVTTMIHKEQRSAVRISLQKSGHQRFNPLSR